MGKTGNEQRLTLGDEVRTAHKPERNRGYVETSWEARRKCDGLTGVAIAEHDSHGLCYEVRFPDGSVVTYDREELEVQENLDDRIDAWHRSDSEQPLHAFLGMSEEEYAARVVGDRHREEHVEYTCIYPQPGCQIDALPDEWRGNAQKILERYKPDRVEGGLKYQGCCCSYGNHRLLSAADAQALRDAGFLVENDTEIA